MVTVVLWYGLATVTIKVQFSYTICHLNLILTYTYKIVAWEERVVCLRSKQVGIERVCVCVCALHKWLCT